MPYIAFDLDALNTVPTLANATGLKPAEVSHGLLTMWAYCFREEVASVTGIHIKGFFGCDCTDALLAFGFLERDGEGYRVCGADRYLKVRQAQREGGKKGRKLSSSKVGTLKSTLKSTSGSTSRSTSGSTSRSEQALTPNTEHRIVEASVPRDSDALCQDFKDIMGTNYVWQGAKDGVALAELRKSFSLEEIRVRWQRGLRAPADTWASCRTVAQLRLKVNDLATAPAKVSIEHQPSRMFK